MRVVRRKTSNRRPRRGWTSTALNYGLRFAGNYAADKAVNYFSGSGSKTADSAPLTTQRDYATYYRKRKSRGRGKKRRSYKRFRRMYRSCLYKEIGCRLQVTNGVGSRSSAVNFGVTWTLSLGHFFEGTKTTPGLLDIWNLLVAGNTSSLGRNADLYAKSGTLDVSLTARATNTVPVDLDVYTIVCKKAVSASDVPTTYADMISGLSAQMRNNQGALAPVTDAGAAVARATSSINATRIGWTPWLATGAMTYFTILKRQKILLTPGATTHLQLKKNWNRKIKGEYLSDHSCDRGFVIMYLFNAFGAYNGTNQPAVTVDFDWQTYHNVKAIPQSEDTLAIA